MGVGGRNHSIECSTLPLGISLRTVISKPVSLTHHTEATGKQEVTEVIERDGFVVVLLLLLLFDRISLCNPVWLGIHRYECHHVRHVLN